MKLFNRRTTAFLLIIALCSVSIFANAARPDTAKNAKPLLSDTNPFDTNKPNLTTRPNANSGGYELFFKMMFMVLLVIALGVAVMYISKKILPKFTHLSAKRIQIIETVHLGPRKAVHLLKVGSQLILIGSTNENITRLSDITELPETDIPPIQTDGS
jgi:flagellar biogenesis protein FliO